MNKLESPSGHLMVSLPMEARYLNRMILNLAKLIEEDTAREREDDTEDDHPAEETIQPYYPPENTGTSNSQIEWNYENLKRLLEYDGPAAIAMLTLTSEKEGQWVPFSAIKELSGRDQKDAKTDMIKFTKFIKEEFGLNDNNWGWPATPKQGACGGNQMAYMMKPAVARIWRQLLSEIQ